jgi:type VI secretion system Hcp family effector
MSLQKRLNRLDQRPILLADCGRNRASLALLRFGCIAMMLAAAISARGSVEIFMRIGGQAAAMGQIQTAPVLASESTDPQYPNWIQVLSMSHGVSNAGQKPSHQDLSYMKLMDKTTPSMCLLVNATNITATVTQPIDYVTLDFRQTGTTNVFYRMELQGVNLSSEQISASSEVPSESVSLRYTKIRWSYVPYVSGKAGTPITTGWDVVAGKAY